MYLLVPWQDGILFGMVGAYDWDGAVLKESRIGRFIPPREAFEREFPLRLKNHAAYLGKEGCRFPLYREGKSGDPQRAQR